MAKSTIRKSTSETNPTPAARRRTTAGEGAAESTPKATARPRRKAETPVQAGATQTVAVETARPANGTPETEITHDRIAERAYHLFLQRGGYPGDQFQDWVTAERQLREQSRH